MPTAWQPGKVCANPMPLIALSLNGQDIEVDVDPETPLLWVLRDHLGMTGTKYGCGIGFCGACTVLFNGHVTRACNTPVAKATGYAITTIEGLSRDSSHPVQQAWLDEDVAQCGYCQPGQILAAAALLAEKANPSDSEINDAMRNLCRCGTYGRIRSAIRRVARERDAG